MDIYAVREKYESSVFSYHLTKVGAEEFIEEFLKTNLWERREDLYVETIEVKD